MQKVIKLSVFLFIFFILGVFFFSLKEDSNYDTKNLIGKKLPEFKLEDFYTKKILEAKDFKNNKFTLINFWASWCGPCRNEHPVLIKLSKSENLKIIGVNFKDKKVNASKFLKDLGNPYDFIAKDQKGKQSVNFGIYGIPESILIDKDFFILKKYIGPLSIDDLEEIINIINIL